MSANIKVGWLHDAEGVRFAPRTLASQVQTNDGTPLEDEIKAKISAAKTDVEEKIEEVRNLHSDWAVNDSNDPDYIKNRTHYEETNLINITGLEYEKSVYSSESSYDFTLPLELGQVWNIWHDASGSGNQSLQYENLEVQEDNSGELYIGDLNLSSVPFYAKNEKLVFSTNFMEGIKPSIFKIVGVSGTYVGEHIVHQLDEKYIPDTIMRAPTTDDALELVAELGLAEPMTDDEGNVLTDENGILFIL